MSEKSEKDTRLDAEGFFNDALSGAALENALDFAAYLKANGMAAGGVHGEVSYKGRCVCYMYIDASEQKPAPWTIWTDGDYGNERGDVPMDGRMKEIAWANVNFCADCGGGCSPGKSKVILGKEFNNVCSADMAFYVPDAETLECVKKLLDMRKNAITDSLR